MFTLLVSYFLSSCVIAISLNTNRIGQCRTFSERLEIFLELVDWSFYTTALAYIFAKALVYYGPYVNFFDYVLFGFEVVYVSWFAAVSCVIAVTRGLSGLRHFFGGSHREFIDGLRTGWKTVLFMNIAPVVLFLLWLVLDHSAFFLAAFSLGISSLLFPLTLISLAHVPLFYLLRALFATFIQSFVEEKLFRHVFHSLAYRMLTFLNCPQYYQSFVVVLSSSLVFAAIHLPLAPPIYYLISLMPYLMAGLTLGILYEAVHQESSSESKALGISTMAHTANNFGCVLHDFIYGQLDLIGAERIIQTVPSLADLTLYTLRLSVPQIYLYLCYRSSEYLNKASEKNSSNNLATDASEYPNDSYTSYLMTL